MTASNSLLVAVLLFALPSAAFADATPSPPTEDQVQAARVPYREARELHRQGRIKEALERALEAYRIASTPITALEAGQLLVEVGRLVEARDVARSVSLFPVSPRESDKGREARQEAATLGATLDARIPKVAIAGRSPGMDVTLDGKPFPASDPAAWMGVDPGSHAILVRAGDRMCTSINLTLAETEARTIDLHDVAATCHSDGAAPLPAENAQPSRDSAFSSPSPIPTREAPAASPAPSADLTSRNAAWRWSGAILAGAGVIAVGAGAGVAFAAKSNYDSVGGECGAQGCTASAFGVRNSARSEADVATVPIIAGAAAIVGGALLFLLAPRARSGDAGRPVVGIGPGSVDLAFRFQ